VCADNGVTYKSMCDMRRATCLSGTGLAVKFAYQGPCVADCICADMMCQNGDTCVISYLTSVPFCVNCDRPCYNSKTLHPVCGSNNVTYINSCVMINVSCETGVYIDAIHSGPCHIGSIPAKSVNDWSLKSLFHKSRLQIEH